MIERFLYTIIYDLEKGTKDNKLKWLIAFCVFLFFSNYALEEELLNGYQPGFWGVWIKILGGMPEYVKSETSIFELPVSWLLFYAFMFFIIGFYSVSDLHSFGAKTLLLSGDRRKWIVSKYIWIVSQVFMYFILFAVSVGMACILNGCFDMDIKSLIEIFGIDVVNTNMSSFYMACIVLPFMVSIAISYMQFTLSIVLNSILGYITSISLLVVSAYWTNPVFIGNYLMILRNQLIVTDGFFSGTGILVSSVLIILMCFLGIILFRKKDIYKII